MAWNKILLQSTILDSFEFNYNLVSMYGYLLVNIIHVWDLNYTIGILEEYLYVYFEARGVTFFAHNLPGFGTFPLIR